MSRRRSKEQQAYFEAHPKCEICGRPAQEVHHVNHNRRDDSDKELFSMCLDHHRGNRGVHMAQSEFVWIEQHLLAKHPKWKARYQMLKSKRVFAEKIRRLFNG